MTTEMSSERRKQLLRATEDMVTAHRIEAITREHASIANLLDHREIFELDEIQIKQGKFVKIEADSRVQSRRGARAETEIKPVASQAVESFKEKGINVQLLSGGYDLELRVWKEKSSKAAYAEQRKFQYPELETFLVKMPKKQKMEYKQKVGAAIIQLAEKFREECRQLKADMDLNGIFHPEANAHRVHCIYLTMLHKHISAKTIETPVLKEMYKEEQKRRREEAARDEEKAQLLREMEERDRNAEKLRNRMLRRSMDGSITSPLTQNASADNASQGQQSQIDDGSSQGSSKRKLKAHSRTTRETIAKPQQSKLSKTGSMRSTSSSSVLPNIQSSLRVKTNLAEIPSASSGAATSPQARKEKVQLEPPEKSFKRKLRQTVADGQVTNVLNQDTQISLLSSEVSRLQQAEVLQVKRPKDRTDAWQETMSQWMLQDLQGKQVSRVAAGTVGNVGATFSSPVRQSSIMSSPPAGVNFADTNGTTGHSSAMGAVYSMGLSDTTGLQLQQQVNIDLQALQRQQQQKEQWKSFGKAAVLAVDRFLAENEHEEQTGSLAEGIARFQSQHQSPTGGMRGVYSPSRYVPFDEFYGILKKTSDPLLESVLALDDSVLLPASLAATQSLPQLQQQMQAISPSSALRRVASMSSVIVGTAGPPAVLTSSLSMKQLTKPNDSIIDTASFACSTSNTSQNQQAASAVGIESGTGTGSGPLNIVDVMRQNIEPKNFIAYEKVQDLTLPSAKLLARLNGSTSGPRRASHLGAIGHTAIELRDSFGRLGRDANKGFDNLFSTQRLQEKGLLAERGHQREDTATGVLEEEDDPFMDNDDVVRRLERTGDLGERTRGGKMRATDMDAMLEDISRRSPSTGESTPAPVVTFGGSPIMPRSISRSRRHRAGGTRSGVNSPLRGGSPAQRQRNEKHQHSPGSALAIPLEDTAEDEPETSIPDDELDLQHKLVAAWDTLGVTANDRLSFMLKYSDDVHAAEMSRAIDLWAGVAVCHVVLQRLLSVRDKSQHGLLLVPLSALHLWRHIIRPVPALLRLNHEALIPPTLVFIQGYGNARDSDQNISACDLSSEDYSSSSHHPTPSPMPFSVHLILRLQHILCSVFAQHISSSSNKSIHTLFNADALSLENATVSTIPSSSLHQFHVDDVATVQSLLHDLLRSVTSVLQGLLLRSRSDFDDEIPCGHNRFCRDFVQNIVTQLDREREIKS